MNLHNIWLITVEPHYNPRLIWEFRIEKKKTSHIKLLKKIKEGKGEEIFDII